MRVIVSIVGRPNVGKSTLFNFLTGSRNALVYDYPGVTRDRQYGFGYRRGYEFIWIDTGGLVTGKEKKYGISAYIYQQSLQAVEESDACIWLVDGRDGINAEDERLAPILRRARKPVLLLVNKTEGLDADIFLSDFHGFGFNGPHAISAKRGNGINQCWDMLIDQFPDAEVDRRTADSGPHIALLGRPNVGKSTLINRLLGEKRMITSGQAHTTRDSIRVVFKCHGTSYTLIDTAGIRKRSKTTGAIEKFSVLQSLKSLAEAQIVILILDARTGITEQDSILLGHIVAAGKAFIIAVNKWDHPGETDKKRIKAELDRRLGFIDYACIQFISALHGSHVSGLLASIKRVSKSLATRHTTAEVTTALEKIVADHMPPLVNGRRIKLKYAHIGTYDPLKIIIHGNQVEHLPVSYKRYLSAQMRKRLKLTGVPILIDLKKHNNPYRHRKNILTARQFKKRQRLINYAKH